MNGHLIIFRKIMKLTAFIAFVAILQLPFITAHGCTVTPAAELKSLITMGTRGDPHQDEATGPHFSDLSDCHIVRNLSSERILVSQTGTIIFYHSGIFRHARCYERHVPSLSGVKTVILRI
jgi:hypothetical protein